MTIPPLVMSMDNILGRSLMVLTILRLVEGVWTNPDVVEVEKIADGLISRGHSAIEEAWIVVRPGGDIGFVFCGHGDGSYHGVKLMGNAHAIHPSVDGNSGMSVPQGWYPWYKTMYSPPPTGVYKN